MKLNTICIIDDDPIFVYSTRILLNHNKDFGDDVLVYENGKEALNNLSSILHSGQELPNIIFLDLNMPFMNGWEFLDAFIKLPIIEKPLVFITTSSINQEDKDRALGYKIVKEFIVKPLYDSKLKELLTKY